MARPAAETAVSRSSASVVAEQRRHRVVVLAAQPVAAAAGDDVDGVAHVEEVRVRRVDPAVRAVGEPGLREGARAPSCRAARRGPP